MNTTITVVAMIITVAMGALSIWANMRIKFAPDIATVRREMKSFFVKILVRMVFVSGASILIWVFCTAPWPLDRLTFALVILNCLALSHVYINLSINTLLKQITELWKSDNKILELIGKR